MSEYGVQFVREYEVSTCRSYTLSVTNSGYDRTAERNRCKTCDETDATCARARRRRWLAMSKVLYAPAAGCEATLDLWCRENCPHAAAHELYARFDTNFQGHQKNWRCYATETLDASRQHYVRGNTYCTRHPQLSDELEACKLSNPNSPSFDSESAYGPESTKAAPTRTLKYQQQPPAQSVPVASAATSRRTLGAATEMGVTTMPTPARSRDGTCEDSVAECQVWARYDECRQNAPYMSAACAVSCRTCDGKPSMQPATPRTLPLPPPSPQPSPPPPSPPSLPDSVDPSCANVCEARSVATEGPVCSGAGHCSEWDARQWCVCTHSADVRRVGLRCERSVGEGIECDARCTEHGTCVHGFCECDHGWHGESCSEEGMAEPFLSVSRLHAAGLVSGREGSKAAKEAACERPSIHAAYARNASLMEKLLDSLPEEPKAMSCRTCAVVSNAGSLLESKHGKAIDKNDCVWRMNRAPTEGYEKHVGKKTTLDWVNSFPHLRDVRILPRVGTPLLHGMTVDLFNTGMVGPYDPKTAGFGRFMAWLSGHVAFKEQHPDYEANVIDIGWYANSWLAYWAYLAPWVSPSSPMGFHARPSSGWHVARLALDRCAKVRMYGFSMSSDKFHYFDSLVQEPVSPMQRDPQYGTTHRFAWEHEVFINWTKTMPERFELIR